MNDAPAQLRLEAIKLYVQAYNELPKDAGDWQEVQDVANWLRTNKTPKS